MSKRFLSLAAALTLAASIPVGAQIDITNPTIALAVANADIEAATGTANFQHRGMGVHPDTGVLYVIDSLAAGGVGLWSIDTSTGPDTYTQIATAAQISAAVTGAPVQIDCGSISVASDGTVYFHMINGADTIVRVVPGAPPTVTQLRQADGVGNVRLSNDDATLFFGEVAGFGAVANQITSIPVAGGADTPQVTVAAASAVINAATPPPAILPTTVGFAPFDVDAAGNLIWFDEAAFGGSDFLMSAVPAGTVTVALNAASFPVNPGVNAVAVDDLGNVFMFDEFGTGFADSLFILSEDGVTNNRIDSATILAAAPAVSPATTFELKTLHAYSVDSENVIVYGSDDESDHIISFTFGPSGVTSARNWNKFE